jgi:DNA-directed RNA polymerase subunit K
MAESATEGKFTKYEKARILGARALQIAMNAPLLVKIGQEDLEKVRYDPLKIAEIEFESGILPISVKRPLPERKREKLRRASERKMDDESVEKKEMQEEEEIVKEGEIMELANPEDEASAEVEEEAGEEG